MVRCSVTLCGRRSTSPYYKVLYTVCLPSTIKVLLRILQRILSIQKTRGSGAGAVFCDVGFFRLSDQSFHLHIGLHDRLEHGRLNPFRGIF